eukprot:TRINITY_DN1031_c0_g1_i2.p1 TRINITY_DN1031_c0_g1~~TRINITY_DN1031_c0_g1_i2.p1  ORF type:complete len:128 (+),score=16.90 TRINITY_DN1031_c0_g1_i2:88-471(+)
MAKIKFAHWARPIGISAAGMAALSGIPTVFYDWPGLAIGIYAMIVGTVYFILLWRFQFLGVLSLAFEIYYLASVLMISMSVLLYFTVPTILAGITGTISGIFFLIGALMGDKGLTLNELFKPPRAAE